MQANRLTSTLATLLDNSTHGEDTFLVKDLGDNAYLDAVMDGVTSHGGEEASRSVAEALEAASVASPEDVIAVLNEQNEEFYQVGGGRFLLTTASVVLYLGGQVSVISAGDSPVFHIKADSFEQLSGRVGGILRMGTAQAIGASQGLPLHRAEAVVEPGDWIVVASDGVTDNLKPGELVDLIRAAGSPEAASIKIKATIDERLSQGITPELLGGRFRHDDQTAIFRLFG
ncbi:MAG: PP2C family protein-serine/threonine phosphatase [Dehalococcoidia bacterium]